MIPTVSPSGARTLSFREHIHFMNFRNPEMSKSKARKRSSDAFNDLNIKKAYADVLDYVVIDEVWVTEKMKAFMKVSNNSERLILNTPFL